MSRILYCITCSCIVFSLYAQASYTTVLGQTIIINDDFSYENAPVDDANSTISPFEMPARDAVLLSEEELSLIYQMESVANQKEISYFIALEKLKATDTLTDASTSVIQTKDLWTKSKEMATHVQQLKREQKNDRLIRYNMINELAVSMGELAFDIPTTEQRPLISEKKIKPDTRKWYEIIDAEDCQIIFDDYDQNLEADRKETKARHFFGYTHPRLQRHFRERDYVQTIASMAKIDGDYFLILKIDIASKSASKNYGAIQPKDRTRIRLVDGSTIYLRPVNEQKGQLQEYTGHTIYNPIYQIDKSDVKRLEKTEVDDIGIMWTSGFENYEVYHVDALQKLATCIRK